MSKKKRKTPRITTQPRIPHWSYQVYDKGDYLLIKTANHKGAPCATQRLILRKHEPEWMRVGRHMIDLAYDHEAGNAVVPGFGAKYADWYTFYAQTENVTIAEPHGKTTNT